VEAAGWLTGWEAAGARAGAAAAGAGAADTGRELMLMPEELVAAPAPGMGKPIRDRMPEPAAQTPLTSNTRPTTHRAI
jgi:hypothetical protein